MAPWLIRCFIVILLYIEKKLFLEISLATILPSKFKLFAKFHCFDTTGGSIQMLKKFPKNFKTFYEAQTMSRVKEKR